MAITQLRGNTQIMDNTIILGKMQSDFLSGQTWNLSSANDAVLTGLGSPTSNNDAANKAYVDGLVDTSMKAPDGYSTNAAGDYPTDYKGTGLVSEGDTFYITNVSNGTTVGAKTVNVGDLLVALVDTPGNTDNNWVIMETNRDQATETIKGVAEIATQTEADTGTNDTNIITPLKLATYLSNANISSITASNGLTKTGNDIQLGGTLTGNVSVDTQDHDITIANTVTDNTGTITLGDDAKTNTTVIDANTAINIGIGTSSGNISLATGMSGNNVTIGSASSSGTLSVEMGVVNVASSNNLVLNSLSGQVVLGSGSSTAVTFNDSEVGAAATTTAIPFAITDSASGTAGKIIDDFRAAFTDEGVVNAIVANYNAIASSSTTASNGLTKTGNDIQLGGTLTGDTTIDVVGNAFTINDGYGLGTFNVGDNTNPMRSTFIGQFRVLNDGDNIILKSGDTGGLNSAGDITLSAIGASGGDGNVLLETGGGNTIKFTANSNDVVLDAQPDGTVALAVATTQYVDTAVGGTKVFNELPTVTNASTDVTLANAPATNTQVVYLNGIVQAPGASNDYTVSGTTITFSSALQTGDVVLVNYLY